MLADRAKHYGVTLCFKAHVGQYVYNTATTLKVLEAVNHPNLGLDMDPSHVWRAGVLPSELGALLDEAARLRSQLMALAEALRARFGITGSRFMLDSAYSSAISFWAACIACTKAS